MADLETEIVKIVWDIENPEAAITKLVTRLGEIDAKLGEIAQKAAQFGANIAVSLNAAGASADALVGKMERALAGMEAVTSRAGSASQRDPLTGRYTKASAFQAQYGSPEVSQTNAQAQAIENLVRGGMSRADAEAGVRAATRGAGYSPFQARASLYGGEEDWLIGRKPGPWQEFDPATGAPIGGSEEAARLNEAAAGADQMERMLKAANLKRMRSRMLMEGALAQQRLDEEGVNFGRQDFPGQAFREGYDAWAPIKNWQMRRAETEAQQSAEWNRQAAFQPGIDAMRAQARAQFQPEIDAGAYQKQYDSWASLERSRLQEQAQMQQPISTTGLTGTAQTQAFQANLGQANEKLNALFQNYQRLRTPEAEKAWLDQAKAVDQYKQAIGRAGDEMGRFDRHLLRVAESIIIWTVFRTILRGIEDVIKGAVQEMLRLESVQARVSFISPGRNVAQENITAAQYGITPAQAAPGAITAAQLGLGQAEQQKAAQLAQIFGAEQYNNILQELYQTQIAFTASGQTQIDVMEYLATAFKTAPTNIENYFDALQKAALVSEDLGLSTRQTALGILEINKATELSPDVIATTLKYAIGRLGQPEIQKNLEPFGIKAGRPEVMIREIATEIDKLVSSGNPEKAQRLIEAITGGLQGPSRALQLQVAFQALNKIFLEGEKPISDINDLLEKVGNTGETAFNRLSAAFKVYLSLLATAPGLTNLAGGIAADLQARSTYAEQARRYQEETGLSPTRRAGNVMIEDPRFTEWIRQQQGIGEMQSRNMGTMGGRFIVPPGKGAVTFPEPPAFGGFQTFPKGQDWDQFKSLVRDYETKLKDVPGYKVDRQQIAFLDEQSKQFRYLLADTNAIRFATEEQRKLMAEQITGVFNIPDSGRALVAFYALSQGYVPRDRADALGAGAMDFPKAKDISDPITTAVYTVNDTLVTWASQFAAARDAYGGKQGGAIQKADPLDVYNQYLPNVGTPKAGQEMHARQVNAQRLPRPQSFVEEFAETHNLPVMRERHTPSQRAPQLSIPITINSRIVVNVDGRRIQQQINRQTYQQFSQIAGGAGVASGSSVL